MRTTLSKIVAHGILALTLGAGFIGTGSIYAQERRGDDVREPYRAQHWIFDDRHNHGHYYPSIGYAVDTLPPGYVALSFASRRFFFQAGVWYEPTVRGFAVVRPPLGIFVPVLPPAYSTVMVGGVPYYYANDLYYTSAPGGYAVSNPPQAGTYTELPSAPPLPPAPSGATPAPQSNGTTWYYCDSAKTYYPYVATCKEGWRAVPANVPPQR